MSISAALEGEKTNSRIGEQAQSVLLKYRLKKDQPSKILSDHEFSNLAEHMYAPYRRCDWQLLYRMSEHGRSGITFSEKIQDESNTLLICEDEKGHKFGTM